MQSVHLAAGMEAPHFELPDADMGTFALTTQRGKKNIVLYFYPRDDTPGCTMEANEFSELEEDLAKFDTIVIGISRDDCLSQRSPFVIDKQGKLRHVMYGVHAHGHAQEIFNLIKEMK